MSEFYDNKKLDKEFSSKYIKKTSEKIQSAKYKIEKGNLENQAKCPHKDGKQFALEAVVGGEPGEYRCKLCGKAVKITPHSIDEVRNALKIIDETIDIQKMISKQEDEKIRIRLAKIQLTLPVIGKNQEILIQSNNNRKNTNRNKQRGGSVTFMQG